MNPRSQTRSLKPAIALFFVAPLVAEFLLGNLPIKLLPALVLLGPMYGGAALLIRETVRRTGRGWPSILLMGIAYGILEEAFATQSLFNPDYLGMHLGLLKAGYLPALGIGGWWTVFVLNLHAIWSIMASIALVEGAVPARARTPWLGRVGLAVTAMVFAIGFAAMTMMSYRNDRFIAWPSQFSWASLTCTLLVTIALRLPRRVAATQAGGVPNPWAIGGFALAAGSAVLLVPRTWGWGAAIAILGIDLIAAGLIGFCSRRSEWSQLHVLAAGSGAALAYAWHAFIETPIMANGVVTRIGNGIFAAGAIGLIWFAARKTSRAVADERSSGGRRDSEYSIAS